MNYVKEVFGNNFFASNLRFLDDLFIVFLNNSEGHCRVNIVVRDY
jgi:hypothetical protein